MTRLLVGVLGVLVVGCTSTVPHDASVDVTDTGRLAECIALCESCPLWPCPVHCARDCAPAATAAGTCAAFRACVEDPAP